MKIKLNEGTEVYVEAFHCTPTLAGVIAYSPSESTNQNLINHLHYPTHWGKRVCVMKKSDMYISNNILKPMINSVWLTSKPIGNNDNESYGSDLVVMFFSEENDEMTIRQIIADGVGDLDWKKYAQNYQL